MYSTVIHVLYCKLNITFIFSSVCLNMFFRQVSSLCDDRVIFLLCNCFLELQLRRSLTKLPFIHQINSLHKGM